MNTLTDPARIVPHSSEIKLNDDQAVELPPSSYTIIELTTTTPIVTA
jgi:alpha-N-arabinofuranosidase